MGGRENGIKLYVGQLSRRKSGLPCQQQVGWQESADDTKSTYLMHWWVGVGGGGGRVGLLVLVPASGWPLFGKWNSQLTNQPKPG